MKHPWFRELIQIETKTCILLTPVQNDMQFFQPTNSNNNLTQFPDIDLDEVLNQFSEPAHQKMNKTSREIPKISLPSIKQRIPLPTPNTPQDSTKSQSTPLFALKKKLILPRISTATDDLDTLLAEIDNIDSGFSDIPKSISSLTYKSPTAYQNYSPRFKINDQKLTLPNMDKKSIKRGGFLGFLRKGTKRETESVNDFRIQGIGSSLSEPKMNDSRINGRRESHRTTWGEAIKDKKDLLPIKTKRGIW